MMQNIRSALHASQRYWSTSPGRVIVLGEAMLDEFYYATEAQSQDHRRYLGQDFFREGTSRDQVSCVPGGAARMATNLAALGIPTTMVSVVGDDAFAKILSDETQRFGIETHFTADPVRPTCRKLRVIPAELPISPK